MGLLTRREMLRAGAGAAAGTWLLGPGAAVDALAQPSRRPVPLPAEDGYDLWLRYRRVANPGRRREYERTLTEVVRQGDSAVLRSAEAELLRGLGGLTGRPVPTAPEPSGPGVIVLGTGASSAVVRALVPAGELDELGPEGYVLRRARHGRDDVVVVAGAGERGVLYGAFHLLRLLQTEQRLAGLDVRERPVNPLRLLNHWDNLDGTVERGYAGRTIFFEGDVVLGGDPRGCSSRRASPARSSSVAWRRPTPSTPAWRAGGATRPRRSTPRSPTSAGSSSRPTPRASPDPRTTGAATPRARTRWPPRSRRTAAWSSGGPSSTSPAWTGHGTRTTASTHWTGRSRRTSWCR